MGALEALAGVFLRVFLHVLCCVLLGAPPGPNSDLAAQNSELHIVLGCHEPFSILLRFPQGTLKFDSGLLEQIGWKIQSVVHHLDP